MKKKIIIGIGVLIGLFLVIGITASFAGHKTTTVHTTTTAPTVTAPAPTVTQTVTPPPPAVTPGQVLLNFTGSGNETTRSFTVTGSGDYIVYWTFSGNDTQDPPQPDDFTVSENNWDTSGQATSGDLPIVTQTSGSGNTEITGDTGTHSFDVQADPGSSWTIKVVSAS